MIMPFPGVDSVCSQTYFGARILRKVGLDAHPAHGDETMKNNQTASSELSGEVRDLLYRIELSAPTRRIAEDPAIPENTLRRWCRTDEEFRAARTLAGELGIQLLN